MFNISLHKWNLKTLATLIISLSLFLGCTIKGNVPLKTPAITMDNRLPFKVVLVVPESVRQHECSCLRIQDTGYFPPNIFNIYHDCGSALFNVCARSMGKVFAEVQTVRSLDEAMEPWDRVLWLEVKDFDISCYTPPISSDININFKYKLTDKNDKILFASNISRKTKEKLDIPYTSMTSSFIEGVALTMVEEIVDAYKKGEI